SRFHSLNLTVYTTWRDLMSITSMPSVLELTTINFVRYVECVFEPDKPFFKGIWPWICPVASSRTATPAGYTPTKMVPSEKPGGVKSGNAHKHIDRSRTVRFLIMGTPNPDSANLS